MTDISVFPDRGDPSTWIVEDDDADGDGAISSAIFEGYQAELRARAHANWLQTNRIRGMHPWWPIALGPQNGDEIALLSWLDEDTGYVMLRGCWRHGGWWNLEAGEAVHLEVLAWTPLPRKEDRELVKTGRFRAA